MQHLLSHICLELTELLNENVIFKSYELVSGGDINLAYKLQTNKGVYFVKTNNITKVDMFEKEVNGLNLLLSATHSLTVPKALLQGKMDSNIYLVMEWIEKGRASKNFWKDFGEGLAQLHYNTNSFFGLEEDNYIGSLSQSNMKCNTWAEFYASQRILPLVTDTFNKNKLGKNEVEAAESLCGKLEELFPAEEPALLHGDLWGGNYMIDKTGSAAIYDPAVYYGNREMDLGMSLLFGGFDHSLYNYYNEVYAMQDGWRTRIDLCQLYPLLVHLSLFGGRYYYDVKEILEKYR